jgi:polysaccharide export outer membrane protein
MFKYDEGYLFAELDARSKATEQHYIIQPFDYLQLEVYTNNGERIIDPDLELNKEMGGNQNRLNRPEPEYLILTDSTVTLPMIGSVKLGGLTIDQARVLLQNLYAEYYADPFVILMYTNKRVVVLGATGGQVIPLRNENMSVVEVVALAGGITNNTHADNLRLIRGDQVFLIDLSTLNGYYESNMIVESGDIIYVEPIPRVLTQGAQEISLIVSTITALTTLLLLVLRY